MPVFWEKLHEAMDTRLNFSSAYHPQADGQTERVNQILEDMLRAYTLKDRKSWHKCVRMQNSHTTIAIRKV
jgi:hypothetical protein